MRFLYLTLSAFAALAAAADNANPFNIPNGGYSFTAGKPTTLTWKPTTDGTVTLRLQWGSVMTPESGSVIAKSISNSGSYTWTPPADLAAQPDYTVEIIDDSDTSEVNYLPRFTVSGATAAATTSSAASTSTSSASTSSSTEATTSSASKTHTTMSTATSTGTSTSSSSTSGSSTASSTASQTTGANASSTSSSASETTVPNTNAGMANKASGGLMVAMLGAFALL
ncbi:Ser-Thr-rich glycosyl-phosphatidyl-inositol-anchored membrane family-domain-containing protein [Aspergillus ambiguus]|uniref:GPI anchored serine-threonine rich family protein n=1 Tax=Aspergillus ambiguus TaxID=176160 RepID=UPI003CCE4C0E